MLMLVTSDNLLQLFFGWEGVGLCSYLLIGYWYDRPSACAAAIKAFIVNRIADLFFAVGLALIFLTFGTLDFNTIFADLPRHAAEAYHLFGANFRLYEVMGVLLFIGAMGKSAQLFFHVWLPDAMEGPTPVSALIHAATMVTAGVFLMARMSPLMDFAPTALTLVEVIGASTCIFAATIGCVQNDIKKVIAYSTCSQLGYMFVAAGVMAYPASIFHLLTHAFFKALLFMCAGSVIHAMSDEQDMRRMGGLWRKIPVDLRDHVDRQPLARRHLSFLRLLLQGRGPGGGVCFWLSGRNVRVRRRDRGGVLHRVLFLAPAPHDVSRQIPRRAARAGACA